MSENEETVFPDAEPSNVEPTEGTNQDVEERQWDEVTSSYLVVPVREKDAVLPEVDPEEVNETPEYPAAVNSVDEVLDDSHDRFRADVPEGKSKEWAVRFFQQRLKNLGYNLETTGHLNDQRTEEALEAFQKDNGLTKTENVTQKTWDTAFEKQ